MRCLALNASFEPLTMVPVRRALRLVIEGKAEIVESDSDDVVRSERLILPKPAIIRLMRFVHVPRRFRRQVTNTFLFARDGYRCQYCGKYKAQLRGREFLMKDAYSFDADVEQLDASYDAMYEAYCRIFDRCGIPYVIVEAESGPIGGDCSHEFMVPATIGYVGVLLATPRGAERLRGAARPLPAAAGILSFVAYALVLAALLLAPAASVAAVRETSVLIAALLAAPMLGERVGPGRLVGAALVVGGVALIALG